MKLMAALDLVQFLCIAWLKSNMRGSSEEALQPKPNSSSDRSGFIWRERLSKVQICSVKSSLHTYIAIRQHHSLSLTLCPGGWEHCAPASLLHLDRHLLADRTLLASPSEYST